MANTIEENEINTEFNTEGFDETINDVTQAAGGVAAIGAAAEYSEESINNLITSLSGISKFVPALQILIKYQEQLRKDGRTAEANKVVKNIKDNAGNWGNVSFGKNAYPQLQGVINLQEIFESQIKKYENKNGNKKELYNNFFADLSASKKVTAGYNSQIGNYKELDMLSVIAGLKASIGQITDEKKDIAKFIELTKRSEKQQNSVLADLTNANTIISGSDKNLSEDDLGAMQASVSKFIFKVREYFENVSENIDGREIFPVKEFSSAFSEVGKKYFSENAGNTIEERLKNALSTKTVKKSPSDSLSIEELLKVFDDKDSKKINVSVEDLIKQLDDSKESLKKVNKTLNNGDVSLNDYLKNAESLAAVNKVQKSKNAEKKDRYLNELNVQKENLKNAQGFLDFYKKRLTNDDYESFSSSLRESEKRLSMKTSKKGKIKFNDYSIFDTSKADVENIKQSAWSRTDFHEPQLMLPNYTFDEKIKNNALPDEFWEYRHSARRFIDKQAEDLELKNYQTRASIPLFSGIEESLTRSAKNDLENHSLKVRTISPELYKQEIPSYLKEVLPQVLGEFASGWKRGDGNKMPRKLSTKEIKDSVTPIINDFYDYYANGISKGLNEGNLLYSYLESDGYKQLRSKYKEKYYLTGDKDFERAKKLGVKNARYEYPKTIKESFDGKVRIPKEEMNSKIAEALKFAAEGGFEKEDYYKNNYWKNIENIKAPLFRNSESDKIQSRFLSASPYKGFEYTYANYSQNKLAEKFDLKKANIQGVVDFGIIGAGAFNSIPLNDNSYIESFGKNATNEKQQIKNQNSKEMQFVNYEQNLKKLQEMLQDEIVLRDKFKTQLAQAELEVKQKGLSLDEERDFLKPFRKQLKGAEDSIKTTSMDMTHVQNSYERTLKNNKNNFSSSLKDSALSGLARWSKKYTEKEGRIGGFSKAGQNFFSDKALGHFGGKKVGDVWSGGVNIGGGIVGTATQSIEKLTNAIKEMGKNALNSFKEIQTTKTNLGVVYGTRAESDSMFTQISNYATESPFGVKQTADFAVLLKQSGVKDIDLMTTLQRIADTAGGSSDKYNRIANNFAQIVAQGKATSIDLRQFANAGIPIYELLKKQLNNSSVAEIRQKTERGEITSDLIEKVFADATSKGGAFYKAVEQGAATYSARLQNMQDIKQLNESKIGELFYTLGDSKAYSDDGYLKTILNIQEKLYNVVGNVAETIKDNIDTNNAEKKESQVSGYYFQIDRIDKKLESKGLSADQKAYYKDLKASLEKQIDMAYGLMPEDIIRTNRTSIYEKKYENAVNHYEAYKQSRKGTKGTLDAATNYDIVDVTANDSYVDFFNSLSAERQEAENQKIKAMNFDKVTQIIRKEMEKGNVDFRKAASLLADTDEIAIGLLDETNVAAQVALENFITEAKSLLHLTAEITAQTDSLSSTKELTLNDFIENANAKITDKERRAYLQTKGNTLGKYQIQTVEKKENLPDSAYSLLSFARQRYEKSAAFKAEQEQKEQEKIEKARNVHDNQQRYKMSSQNGWIKNVTPEEYSNFINENYFNLRDLKVATQEDIRKGGYEKYADLTSTIDNINAFRPGIENLLTKTGITSPVISYLDDFLAGFESLKNANTLTEKNNIINEISQIKGKVFEWLTKDLSSEIEEKIEEAEESGNTNLVHSLKKQKEVITTYISAVFQGRELNEITDEMIQNIDDDVMPFWKRLSSSLMNIPQDIMKLLPDFKNTTKFWRNSNIRQQNESIGKTLLSSNNSSFEEFQRQLVFRNLSTGKGDNETRSLDQAQTNANLLSIAESVNSEVEITKAYSDNLATQVDQLRNLISAGVFRMEDSQMITDSEKAAALGYKKDDINELARLINAFSAKDDETHNLNTLQLIYNELVKQSKSLSIIASVKSFTKEAKNNYASDKGEYTLLSSKNAAKMNIDPETYRTKITELAKARQQGGDTRDINEIIDELSKVDSYEKLEKMANETATINAKNAVIRVQNAKSENDYDQKLKEYEKSLEKEKDLKSFGEAYNRGDYSATFKSKLYKNPRDGSDEFTAQEYVDLYGKTYHDKTTNQPKVILNTAKAKPAEPSLRTEITTPTEGATAGAIEEIVKEPVFKTFALENANLYNSTGKFQDADFGEEFIKNLDKTDVRSNWTKNDLLNIPKKALPLIPQDAFDSWNLLGNKSSDGERDLTLYGSNTLRQQRALDYFSRNGYESMGNESMKNAAYNIQQQVQEESPGDVKKSQFYKNMESKMGEVGDINGLSEAQQSLQLMNLADALGANDTSALEKWIEQFGELGNKGEFLRSKFKDLSSDIKSTAKAQFLGAINNSFTQIGKNIAAGEDASDGLYKIWKNMASTVLGTIGATMTSTGLEIAAEGARTNNKADIVKGLALAAAGGVANIAGGMLSDSSSSDSDDDRAEEQRIQNLKDALADLIDQAKTDAEYYQKNLMHKNALATNESISTRSYDVNDAIITPNGNVVSTHPDDYLIATKTPEQFLNGGSSGVNLQVNSIINNNSSNVTATTETVENADGSIDIITTICDVVNSGLAEGKFDDGLAAYDYRQQGRSVAS